MSKRNKNGIEWQTGFALNGSAIRDCLMAKRRKL